MDSSSLSGMECEKNTHPGLALQEHKSRLPSCGEAVSAAFLLILLFNIGLWVKMVSISILKLEIGSSSMLVGALAHSLPRFSKSRFSWI